MIRNPVALGIASIALLLTGCSEWGRIRSSTIESSELQLAAAARDGFPTELVVEDEPIDALALLERKAPLDPDVTYLVLTRTDAQISWSRALASDPPASERTILMSWVAPYMSYDDRDTAVKAFVFGYLRSMHEAGRIDWEAAVVPFLPAAPSGPPVRNTSAWGFLLAFIVMLVVVRSSFSAA